MTVRNGRVSRRPLRGSGCGGSPAPRRVLRGTRRAPERGPQPLKADRHRVAIQPVDLRARAGPSPPGLGHRQKLGLRAVVPAGFHFPSAINDHEVQPFRRGWAAEPCTVQEHVFGVISFGLGPGGVPASAVLVGVTPGRDGEY